MCGAQVEDGCARTTLECEHAFHARCIHAWLRSNAACCPRCPPASAALDFGDDTAVMRAALTETRRADSEEPGDAPARPGALARLFPALAERAAHTQHRTDNRATWFREGMTVAEMRDERVHAEQLAGGGMTLREWLDAGRTLTELAELDAGWRTLRQLGITSADIRTRRAPIATLVQHYKIGVGEIMDLCDTEALADGGSDTRIQRFTGLALEVPELLLLGATAPMLHAFGMTKADMGAFHEVPFRSWRSALQLTAPVAERLGVTVDDAILLGTTTRELQTLMRTKRAAPIRA